MSEEKLRKVKIAAFTYGAIATTYIGIIYFFILILWPNMQNIYTSNLKDSIETVFLLLMIGFGIYKITSKLKSNFFRAILIVIVPIYSMFYLKDIIFLPILVLMGFFFVRILYKVIKVPDKFIYKLVKLLLILFVIGFVVIKIFTKYYSDIIFFDFIMYYQNLGYEDLVNNIKYYTSSVIIFKILKSYISFIFIGIIIFYLAIKEIVKELKQRYNPTKEEKDHIILGMLVLFVLMIFLTSGVLLAFKKNTPSYDKDLILLVNSNIKSILESDYYRLGDEIGQLSSFSMDMYSELPKTDQAIYYYYLRVSANILNAYYTETQNTTSAEELKNIRLKYANRIGELNFDIETQYNTFYLVLLNYTIGIFAVFIFAEIFEEIYLIKTIKKEEP